ncbi:MAG TPA: ammonium transporter [Blastocatellia bacterium]|nr:ammonium transporter [Blastocatellia bacterium]
MERFLLRMRLGLWPASAILALSSTAAAEDGSAASQVNSGDTAWMIVATALVMLMTAPGLALFYGGLVSHRNVLSTLMHSFFLLCLISVQWVIWGYTLSFGPNGASLIGGLDHLFFNGVGPEPSGSATYPHVIFAMYQCMFAVITVALISGSFAERMKFTAFILFSLLWATVVYDPLAHWVWHSDGWLFKKGALDFAGGTVVHISSGVSALVAAIVIGRRRGHPKRILPPHNLSLTVIGASLLWFGWFGFNAGSALAANGLAAIAFTVTNTAAAAGGLAWLFVEWAHRGKPTILGAVSGAVAGLVGITPAAGYVNVGASLAIGAGAGLLCYLGCNLLKPRFGYDDALDVFGVHGIGGTWGALATGLFASKAINPAGNDGLFNGNPGQLLTQLMGVGAAWALAGVGTFLILKLVSLVTSLRVSEEDELAGLDLAAHGEVAYSFLSSPGMASFGSASAAEIEGLGDSTAPTGEPSAGN